MSSWKNKLSGDSPAPKPKKEIKPKNEKIPPEQCETCSLKGLECNMPDMGWNEPCQIYKKEKKVRQPKEGEILGIISNPAPRPFGSEIDELRSKLNALEKIVNGLTSAPTKTELPFDLDAFLMSFDLVYKSNYNRYKHGGSTGLMNALDLMKLALEKAKQK